MTALDAAKAKAPEELFAQIDNEFRDRQHPESIRLGSLQAVYASLWRDHQELLRVVAREKAERESDE